MTSSAALDVLRELEGMRALARSLVHGDAEADDLLQEAAVAAIEHPPREAPPRPWLAVVLRNRRRQDARAASRRIAREQAIGVIAEPVEHPDAALDRARAFERLGAALVALDEPFRSTVIRRYLDGQSCAEIAESLEVPAGTVRWRLKTGLERLRETLTKSEPRWQRAFAPIGVGFVKSKISILVVIALLLIGAGVAVFVLRRAPAEPQPAATAPAVASGHRSAQVPVNQPQAEAPIVDPLPGQGRVTIDRGASSVSGRVINWSTGAGVDGAELTFTGEGGALTVRSRANGGFELAPPAPGHWALLSISAPGFLPYAPELLHSDVHVEVIEGRVVRGVTVFLFPALDYEGHVVDAKGAPVAGAKVRLLGTPVNEQAIDKLDTEWTSDGAGRFTFHAADNAVFEAVRGTARGWAVLDGDVMNTKQLTITIGNAPARDKTITGRVVENSKGVANVLVRAEPQDAPGKQTTRSTAFATTSANGDFVITDLDDGAYELQTQAEDFAPQRLEDVHGGARNVTLALERGLTIAGVVTGAGEPIGGYTLLVFEREGARRELLLARSIVDATGHFEVRVPRGEYELQAAATGWAPSGFIAANAGARDVELRVSAGATLRGQVLAADGSGPLEYARIMRESRGGGASPQPANAGTVTRADGTFELTGIPPGPVSITIGAGGFHPRIEAGMTASDGASLGPLTINLTKLQPGEQPSLELVGIGAKLAAGKDGLNVEGVFPGSGAEAAGIKQGDVILAVDGISVLKLGLDGAISKIRGTEGTTVSITVQRDGKAVPIVCTRKKLRA